MRSITDIMQRDWSLGSGSGGFSSYGFSSYTPGAGFSSSNPIEMDEVEVKASKTNTGNGGGNGAVLAAAFGNADKLGLFFGNIISSLKGNPLAVSTTLNAAGDTAPRPGPSPWLIAGIAAVVGVILLMVVKKK